MATKVARGKALVAKLRADPKTRDAEALAAWIGRRKRFKKAGLSTREAGAMAGAKGATDLLRKSRKLPDKSGGSRKDDDDPFKEDYGPNEKKSKEDQQRERYEERMLRAMEKAERSRLFSAIRDAGGLQTRADLREEYADIPNTYKRRDGLPGDEMADHLATYFPEFGIESERDLIDFLAA